MKTTRNRRNTCKRALAMLTALTMSFSMLQSVAFADETPEKPENSEQDIAVIVLAEGTEPDTTGAEGTEPDTTGVEGTEPDTTGVEGTEPDASDDEESEPGKPFDLMTDTERPDQTDGVSVGTGTTDNNKLEDGTINSALGNNWDIFYDKENDVYNLTFNIKEDADGDQVIDLTKALELLGQYANDPENKNRPQAPQAPEMYETPEPPAKPVLPPVTADDVEVPKEPEQPVEPEEPGKPAGLDKILDTAYDGILEAIPSDSESGEPTFDKGKATES